MSTTTCKGCWEIASRDVTKCLARMSIAIKEEEHGEKRRTIHLCYNIQKTHVGMRDFINVNERLDERE